MLKIYRRLQPGEQPDVEVGRFLTQTAGFDATPAYLGSARFPAADGGSLTLATAFSLVQNQGDAWHALLEARMRDLEQSAIAARQCGQASGRDRVSQFGSCMVVGGT